MEMHQLRYVVAVARCKSFSRAAERCHVSQPSLSQQIQKLEDELGERLFDRMKREIRLTSHGESFLVRALRILDEVDAAQREAREAKDRLGGTLTIGVLPTIAPYLLPPALADFMASCPKVELVAHEDTTDRLLEAVLALELDLALVSKPIRDKRLEVQELLTEELLVALPVNHPLSSQNQIRHEDLQNERLIVMKEGHCLGDQVLQFCDQREVRPTISFRSAQLETIQELVSAGLGISLVPKMATRNRHAGTPCYVSLQAPRPQRTVLAVWPRVRPLSRSGTEFLRRLVNLEAAKVCRCPA